DDDRPLGHEPDEILEETALAVDGVELLGLGRREPHHLLRHDAQAARLEQGDDLADLVGRNSVGLHDRERTFEHHLLHVRRARSGGGAPGRSCLAPGSPGPPPSLARPYNKETRVLPISAGVGATLMPAACKAAILSLAAPLPPLMIAPAWPMRFPGGAVTP